jgi:CheY-like chemotaxis protein/anti-sigma regulatory factor (Ser/Thr protein kinase)
MKASATATELVQQILAFSRKNDTVFTHLTIQDIIKDVINLLRRSIPQSVQICDQIDMECGPIYGNKSQIHQILMNLGTNASHAMRKNGGVLTILLKEGIGEDQKKNVQLQIMDTGEGIAPDVLEQMFEPYFTTKKEGEGTGLGLSTVHKIVKNHHGNIKVESEPGEGTVFTLHFPLATTEVDRDSITIPATPPEAATGHILFVDDAVINVILGQEILQNAGYTVIGLSDSVEALELFRQQPEEFDLVVTDQQMPKLTGMQMAREMIQIRPDIPILMVSGDEDTEIDPEIRQSGIRENIPKPLSVTTLLTAAAREIQKGRKG